MALTSKRKKLEQATEEIINDIKESSLNEEKHTARIRVSLPPSVKRQLKILVAEKETTISALIYPAILKIIEDS